MVLEAKLRTIPEEFFDEVSSFLDFISFKVEKSYNEETLEAIEKMVLEQTIKKRPLKYLKDWICHLLKVRIIQLLIL